MPWNKYICGGRGKKCQVGDKGHFSFGIKCIVLVHCIVLAFGARSNAKLIVRGREDSDIVAPRLLREMAQSEERVRWPLMVKGPTKRTHHHWRIATVRRFHSWKTRTQVDSSKEGKKGTKTPQWNLNNFTMLTVQFFHEWTFLWEHLEKLVSTLALNWKFSGSCVLCNVM